MHSNDNIVICIQCWKRNFYYHACFCSSIVPRFTKSSNLFIPTETTMSHVILFLSRNNGGKIFERITCKFRLTTRDYFLMI